jgi:hypothetical protein
VSEEGDRRKWFQVTCCRCGKNGEAILSVKARTVVLPLEWDIIARDTVTCSAKCYYRIARKRYGRDAMRSMGVRYEQPKPAD